MGEPPRGFVPYSWRASTCSTVGKTSPLPIGTVGNPVHRAQLDDLVDGTAGTGPSSMADSTSGRSRFSWLCSDASLGEVRPPDHVEERVPLGRGDRGEPDIAVEAWLDARDHHEGGSLALCSPGMFATTDG